MRHHNNYSTLMFDTYGAGGPQHNSHVTAVTCFFVAADKANSTVTAGRAMLGCILALD